MRQQLNLRPWRKNSPHRKLRQEQPALTAGSQCCIAYSSIHQQVLGQHILDSSAACNDANYSISALQKLARMTLKILQERKFTVYLGRGGFGFEFNESDSRKGGGSGFGFRFGHARKPKFG